MFAVPLQTEHKNWLTYDEFKETFSNLSEIIVFHAALGKAMRALRGETGIVDQFGAVMLGVVSGLLILLGFVFLGLTTTTSFSFFSFFSFFSSLLFSFFL